MKIYDLNEAEKGYISGLFDGEGTIFIGYAKRPDKIVYHRLGVSLTNLNKDVMNWLKEKLGGYITVYKAKSGNVAYRWEVHDSDKIRFLNLIAPYSIIKKQQIQIGILFMNTVSRTISKDYNILQDRYNVRENLRNQLKNLNGKSIKSQDA
jgi:hypothetical protein